MKEFDELLELLKGLNITQTSGDWAEDLPIEVWDQHFKGNFKEVKHNLEVDTHRWYETSTTVIKIYHKFLGINFITNTFSESTYIEDCCYTIDFCEMEEFTTTSYKTKVLQK